MTKSTSQNRSKQGTRQGRNVKARRTSSGTWIAIAVGAVVLVGVIALLIGQGPSGTIDGLQTFSGLSRDHVTGPVNYPQTPPVGGAHADTWQNCGIYDQVVPNERAVHSLEHGAVWITYQPNLPANAVEQLRSLVRGHRYALLSPYEGLPVPVVASAWGVQLQVQDAGDSRLAQFLRAYEQGPQTPEPNAPCTGGSGTPSSR